MAHPPSAYSIPHCWVVTPELSDDDTVTAEDMLFPSSASAEKQDGCWDGLNLKMFAMFKTLTLNCTRGLDAFGVDHFYDFTMAAELRSRSASGGGQDGPSPFPLVSAKSAATDEPELDAYVRMVMCDVDDPAGFCIPYQTVGRQLVEDGVSLQDEESIIPSGVPDMRPPNGEILGAATYTRYNIPHSVYIGEHEPNIFYTPFTKVQNATELINQGFADSNGWFNHTVGLKALKIANRHRRRFITYAHAVVFLTDQASELSSNGTVPVLARQRYDMAIPMLSNTVVFKDPVTKMITSPFKISMGILLAAIVLFQCAVLAGTWYHRKHKVMQLSQAPLLIALLMACIMTSMASYLFMPAYNAFCYLQEPLVLTPLTLAATLLLSRLWRIQSILSSASIIGLRTKEKSRVETSIMSSLEAIANLTPTIRFGCITKASSNGSSVASGSGRGRRVSSFRRIITKSQVLFMSFFLCLPQMVTQLVKLTVPSCKMYLASDVNESVDIGRTACTNDSNNISSYVGWTLMILPFVFTLVLAHFARHLPSLFNETHHIFSTARVVALVCAIGFPLFCLSNNAETSPNLTSFVKIAIINSITMSICWFIVGIKLLLIHGGENIVVSNLLTSGSGRSTPTKRSWTLGPKDPAQEDGVDVGNSLSGTNLPNNVTVDKIPESAGDSGLKKVSEAGSSITSGTDRTKGTEDSNDIILHSGGRLLIRPNEALPRSLENEILEMKSLLSAILERTLAGHPASSSDLETLAETGGMFGDACRRMQLVGESIDEKGEENA